MYITTDIVEFKINHVFLHEPVKNIMKSGCDFIKIMYSNNNFVMNGIYMDMEAYEMQPPEEETISMTFEHAIQIMPSLKQRSLSFPDSPDIDSRDFALSAPNNVDFGLDTQNPVWGRNFKLRVKSKTSGKKIDINFKFNKTVSKRLPTPELDDADTTLDNPCED